MTRSNEGTGPDVGWDGFIAGALGALTVALWFLLLDIAAGHPLHTPTVLGEALFSGVEAAVGVDHARQETVMAFSAVHLTVFVALGLAVSWAVARRLGRGGGSLLLAGVLLGFAVGAWILLRLAAGPVAAEVGGLAVLVGNLLAAAVMGGYFLLRFPEIVGRRAPRPAGGAGG